MTHAMVPTVSETLADGSCQGSMLGDSSLFGFFSFLPLSVLCDCLMCDCVTWRHDCRWHGEHVGFSLSMFDDSGKFFRRLMKLSSTDAF